MLMILPCFSNVGTKGPASMKLNDCSKSRMQTPDIDAFDSHFNVVWRISWFSFGVKQLEIGTFSPL